jgi:hypothetical protein
MKREKVNWEAEFDSEKNIYQALAPVQGRVVRRCYGPVHCPRTDETGPRALLLSDVGGISLHSRTTRSVGMERLKAMMPRAAFRAATAPNVAHDDYLPTNHRPAGDKVTPPDFDPSYSIEEGQDPEFMAECGANFVTRLYHHAHGDRRPYHAKKREAAKRVVG